jgi:type IV secretory pathway TraG/TraD family ATPase VirD4
VEVPSQTQNYLSELFQQFKPYLHDSNFLLVMTGLILYAVISLFHDPDKKPKLSKGRFAGRKERKNGEKLVKKQKKERLVNEVGITLSGNRTQPGLFLPNIERGLMVIGQAGSGKTRSVIDPLIEDVLRQGFPLLLYDLKYPEQTSRFAAKAIANGYDFHVFAPGFAESSVCNPIDLLGSPSDKVGAEELAKVFKANFSPPGHKGGDSFWESSGEQALAGLFLLAKNSAALGHHPDILTALAYAQREDLIEAIVAKQNSPDPMNEWVYAAFTQLLQSANSPKTASSILATASLTLNQVVSEAFLPCLCGETTFPLDVKGKTAIVFGFDAQQRYSAGPLVASVLDHILRRNTAKMRQDPLFLVMDEAPSIYLPNLHRYPAENRERGLCTVVGLQNFGQFLATYGENNTRNLIANCATKTIFNPGDQKTAEEMSRFLGDREVMFKQKNYSYTSGKRTTSYSTTRQVRPLVEAGEFLRLGRGSAFVVSPGIGNGDQASIPFKWKFARPHDTSWSVERWDKVRSRLAKRQSHRSFDQRLLRERREQVYQFLPKVEKKSPSIGEFFK